MDSKAKRILTLFLTFFKIGAFTFGGGYAMIPLIQREIVEKHGWMTDEDILDIFAIAESTPGPIAINCATYVGQKQAGIPGSVVATVGLVVPSFVIIYLISTVLDHFLEISFIANAFKGIKIGIGLLILSVAITMLKKMPRKPLARVIAGCAFAAILLINFLSLKISSIALMLMAGAVSLCVFVAGDASRKKGGEQV